MDSSQKKQFISYFNKQLDALWKTRGKLGDSIIPTLYSQNRVISSHSTFIDWRFWTHLQNPLAVPCRAPTSFSVFPVGGHQAGKPATRPVVIPLFMGVWVRGSIYTSFRTSFLVPSGWRHVSVYGTRTITAHTVGDHNYYLIMIETVT